MRAIFSMDFALEYLTFMIFYAKFPLKLSMEFSVDFAPRYLIFNISYVKFQA